MHVAQEEIFGPVVSMIAFDVPPHTDAALMFVDIDPATSPNAVPFAISTASSS